MKFMIYYNKSIAARKVNFMLNLKTIVYGEYIKIIVSFH